MSRINVDQDAVNMHSTNLRDTAGALSSFSHVLCADSQSTITANANGREAFIEALRVIRVLGDAVHNSADQIITISQGFADIDQSASNTAFSV